MSRPPRLWRASQTSSTLLVLVTVLLLQPLSILAQIIDPSKVPACALQCNLIIAAQNLCSPPVTAAPDTTCFCNSNYLVPLKNGQTAGVCDNLCSAAENQALLSYYQGLCANPQAAAPPAAAGATTTVHASTSTVTSKATAVSAQGKGSSSSKPKSWIDTHYQWVIMIIILILAAVLGTIFGVWLKRRHERKYDEKHRDSVLGMRDAMQALRDPHPIPASSTNSRTAMGVGAGAAGAAAIAAMAASSKEFGGSSGSLRSGSSNARLHAARTSSLGAGMRAPSSSASDLKGKSRFDDAEVVTAPLAARRASSRASPSPLQSVRNSSGRVTGVSSAPVSPT